MRHNTRHPCRVVRVCSSVLQCVAVCCSLLQCVWFECAITHATLGYHFSATLHPVLHISNARQIYISAKEPHLCAKQPYLCANEPYICAKIPHIECTIDLICKQTIIQDTYTHTYIHTHTHTHTHTHIHTMYIQRESSLNFYSRVLSSFFNTLQRTASCNTVQHSTTHCNTLQHTAT